MLGCHNCENVPEKNARFEDTACARCRAAQDPSLLSHTLTDPATFSSLQVMHPAYATEENEFPEAEQQFRRMFSALSQALLILIRIRDDYPETFRVVEAKINQPLSSYATLAKQLSCRKQNILYHLKRAVKMCPELSCALIVDSRFSNGHQGVPRGMAYTAAFASRRRND